MPGKRNRKGTESESAKAFAPAPPQPSWHTVQIDWKLWTHPKATPDVWLHEAVALSVGIAPEVIHIYSHGGSGSYSPIFTGPAAHSDLFIDRWDAAVRYRQRGVLWDRVKLLDFGAWAVDQGLSLPMEFPRPGRTAQEVPQTVNAPLAELTTKERTTLLVIIAALAARAKLDINAPSTAARAIVASADDLGVKVGERTVEEVLKDIPDALERRGY